MILLRMKLTGISFRIKEKVMKENQKIVME